MKTYLLRNLPPEWSEFRARAQTEGSCWRLMTVLDKDGRDLAEHWYCPTCWPAVRKRIHATRCADVQEIEPDEEHGRCFACDSDHVPF